MPDLASAKALNAATHLPYTPTAIFVGGTSGIGQATAESFARYTGGNSRIIIIGRNEAAARAIIASFPEHPSSKYVFIQCDVSKLRNVTAACKSLREEHGVSKLNYLFMCPGYVSSAGFTDNGEGLDVKLVLHFYCRFKFFAGLAPQLQAAKDAGEEARVITVALAGNGGPADLTDLGLKKPSRFPFARARSQSPTYNSLLVEASHSALHEFSKRYPNLSFTHMNPGVVKTPLFNSSFTMKAMGFLLAPIAVSAAASDCSEWMLQPMFDPKMKKGAFHLNSHADPVPAQRLYIDQEAQTAVYSHFIEEASRF